jgi:spermidine/putrescine transport system permease protein
MKRGLRWLFLALPIGWVVLAHVGPLIAMARISLLDVYPTAPGTASLWSLAAYGALIGGTGYQAALWHSLGQALAATVVSAVLAWPLAWHVARVPARLRGLRLALLVAPFWTSEVLRMFALVLLLSNRGVLNAVLRWAGLTEAPVALLYGSGAVLAGIVYTVMLTMLLSLYAAFSRVPPELLEAAAELGAKGWQRQMFVVLPLAAGGLASGVALTFLLALGALVAPTLLGGAGTPSFAVVIGSFFSGASGRWPMGAAFSLVLLVVGTACAGGLAFGVRAGAALRARA